MLTFCFKVSVHSSHLSFTQTPPWSGRNRSWLAKIATIWASKPFYYFTVNKRDTLYKGAFFTDYTLQWDFSTFVRACVHIVLHCLMFGILFCVLLWLLLCVLLCFFDKYPLWETCSLHVKNARGKRVKMWNSHVKKYFSSGFMGHVLFTHVAILIHMSCSPHVTLLPLHMWNWISHRKY